MDNSTEHKREFCNRMLDLYIAWRNEVLEHNRLFREYMKSGLQKHNPENLIYRINASLGIPNRIDGSFRMEAQLSEMSAELLAAAGRAKDRIGESDDMTEILYETFVHSPDIKNTGTLYLAGFARIDCLKGVDIDRMMEICPVMLKKEAVIQEEPDEQVNFYPTGNADIQACLNAEKELLKEEE